MIAVEISAHTILLRLRGHLDLNIHVVAPLVDAHRHAKGKVHAYDALLVALWNHIRNLSHGVIPQAEIHSLSIGARERGHHWLTVNGEDSAVTSTHLNLVAVQEWPANRNLV